MKHIVILTLTFLTISCVVSTSISRAYGETVIKVVAINGFEPLTVGEAPLTARSAGAQLKDLEKNLYSIPYQKFTYYSDIEVPLGKESRPTMMRLQDSQLSMRVVAIRADQIQIWIEWRDLDGKKLVESELAIPREKKLLIGYENSPKTSSILAVYLTDNAKAQSAHTALPEQTLAHL